MNGYRLTSRAHCDLVEISEYIARWNPAAAHRLVERLFHECEFLLLQPYSGAPRDNLRPGLRRWLVGNYVIFYRIIGEDVEVLRIRHGAQDFRKLFEGSDE
ncbi:MAG: type II toxin-antitoxin system RelE/ParE family toxin [Verrucomicrobia bacterium]|nr:type II toxin-antitoxin system RelE/ParE family toxin [Verrucomicrobiota bacterium]